MSLTKVTYSMIKGAPFNVLDYANLVTTANAKYPSTPGSFLFSSFTTWRPAIQAAIDAAFAAGGGVVVIPKNTQPYYIDDYIALKSNVTLQFEDWIVLADTTTVGAALVATNADNVTLTNILLDCSGLTAGGTGENGVGIVGGSNIRINSGFIKNCRSGASVPFLGGKGIQVESYGTTGFVADGVQIQDCDIALASARDDYTTADISGVEFTNINAYDCGILLWVNQSNMGSQRNKGTEHTVLLSNFYSRNCGTYEGVFQFSGSSNVKVANGFVIIDDSAGPTSLIRGSHSECTFTDIDFYSNTNAVINLDTSGNGPSSYPNTNNRYDIRVLGTVNYLVDVAVSQPYRTLDNCVGSIQFRVAPAVGWFGNELRNGTSTFELAFNQKVFRATTNLNFIGNGFGNPVNFAALGANTNVAQYHAVRFANSALFSTGANSLNWYEQGTWTPALTAESGSGQTYTSAGTFTRIGNTVTIDGSVTITSLGTLSGRIIITGIPYAKTGQFQFGGCQISGLTLVDPSNVACAVGYLGNSVTFPYSSSSGGGGDNVRAADITGTSIIYFSVTYLAA